MMSSLFLYSGTRFHFFADLQFDSQVERSLRSLTRFSDKHIYHCPVAMTHLTDVSDHQLHPITCLPNSLPHRNIFTNLSMYRPETLLNVFVPIASCTKVFHSISSPHQRWDLFTFTKPSISAKTLRRSLKSPLLEHYLK